jgi:hypothetical protein
MRKFDGKRCVVHAELEAAEFVRDALCAAPRVLYIGTVGLQSPSLYFPLLLRFGRNVDFCFIVENRPNVERPLVELGDRHRAYLASELGQQRTRFIEVDVVADDGATVAGRNAVRATRLVIDESYSDIVVDATGMSRGTCFPIAKQAFQVAVNAGSNMHIVVAGEKIPSMRIRAEANDRPDWIHGFQGSMGSDRSGDISKVWVPQLSEGMSGALAIMYREVQDVEEVCPILPFPSYDLRRADKLLAEHREALRDQWEAGSQDLIYAHETDPMDVFRTISGLHSTRQRVFGNREHGTTTILSPSGWRVGSVGMFLAALEHDLPMLYVETVGYSCKSDVPTGIVQPAPDVSWHLWLAGDPYHDEQRH